MSSYNKYLVIGATGLTGVELVKQLLKENKQVAICVRSAKKAREIFKAQYEEINKVVEHELGVEKESLELEEAIKWADVLVNAAAATFGGIPQISDYQTNKELLALCEKQETKIKKYVLVSAWYVTRPYGPIAIFLNFAINYILGWKALAENKIRQSSIPYMILRPGALNNKQDTATTSVRVTQGDKIGFGFISRANVARTIIKGLEDPNINRGNVTLDLVDSSSKQNSNFEIVKSIKVDDESDFVTADHFKSNKIVTIIIYTILFVIFYNIVMRFKS